MKQICSKSIHVVDRGSSSRPLEVSPAASKRCGSAVGATVQRQVPQYRGNDWLGASKRASQENSGLRSAAMPAQELAAEASGRGLDTKQGRGGSFVHTERPAQGGM